MIDLLLPPRCAGCGLEGSAICRSCRAVIERREDEPQGRPIGLPSDQPAGLVQLEWCASFTGAARACVHVLKYDGELRLAEPLGRLMATRWRRAGIGGQILVPVPVHAQRRRQRGFDQAEVLARVLAAELGLPCLPVLERATATKAQHLLGRQERAGNVSHAFSVRPRLRPSIVGRWVVLIDDVVTTGATLAACTAALHEAGVAAVSALALARER